MRYFEHTNMELIVNIKINIRKKSIYGYKQTLQMHGKEKSQ